MLRARSARWSVALIPLALASCQELRSLIGPGTAQVLVLFDPNPQMAPPQDCAELLYIYTATRTGEAIDVPTADAYGGEESASDAQRETCAIRSDMFTFPEDGTFKQGLWTFRLDVFADGARLFGGICSAVTIRGDRGSGQVRHVITFTQPRSGTTASCTFTL